MPLIRLHRTKSKPYRYSDEPVEKPAFLAVGYRRLRVEIEPKLTTQRLSIPAVLASMSMGSTAGGSMRIIASSP